MKTNLSSQIKLERFPRRYYSPEGEVETTTLTRYEKITTRIGESIVEGVEMAAAEIASTIAKYVKKNGKCVIAFGAGDSTLPV